MNGYKRINPTELDGNVFRMIGDDWMLVTATDAKGSVNTMTASWGGMGILWGEPVCFVFVRPQRHTHEFTESGDKITLSFFGGGNRSALNYCGTVSGRDTDKIKNAGLTTIVTDEGAVGFSEAKVIISCHKLYSDKLKKECFHEVALLSNYRNDDFHTVYVYKIDGVYTKNEP